jgi:hypothetical protein
VPEPRVVPFAGRGEGDHRSIAAALQRITPAFEPQLPRAQRVRGARSKTSAPSGYGPGRCGTSGLRAPARCATVPLGTNCSQRRKPSQPNRGPKNQGRSGLRLPASSCCVCPSPFPRDCHSVRVERALLSNCIFNVR